MRKRSKLYEQFWAHGKVKDCPVYDMHAHMGKFGPIYLPYNEAEDMVKRMEMAGVKMALFSHHGAILGVREGMNDPCIEPVHRFPNRLRAYMSVNGNYQDIMKKDLRMYEKNKDVFVGLKLHYATPLGDKRNDYAYSFANERKLLVLMHTWGFTDVSGPKEVRKVAEKFSDISIFMGHSCHGEWDEAGKLAKEFRNVYCELCAVPDERNGVIEKFVETAGSEKILYGTDLPWFTEHYYIGTVLGADITDNDRRNIFYRNAERLLKPLF